MIAINEELLAVLKNVTAHFKKDDEPFQKLEQLKAMLRTLPPEEQRLIDETPNHALIIHLMLIEGDIQFKRQINDELSIVTDIHPPQFDAVTTSYIRHDATGDSFDLAFVDLYQHEGLNDAEDETYRNHISSYLYGDPANEDWTHRKITMFDDIIKQVDIEN